MSTDDIKTQDISQNCLLANSKLFACGLLQQTKRLCMYVYVLTMHEHKIQYNIIIIIIIIIIIMIIIVKRTKSQDTEFCSLHYYYYYYRTRNSQTGRSQEDAFPNDLIARGQFNKRVNCRIFSQRVNCRIFSQTSQL